MHTLDSTTQSNLSLWLNGPYDQETKLQLKKMIETDPQQVVDAFYQTLSFGTGGLRGIVGLGTNRINRYTIAQATQGLANTLKKIEGEHSVVIGYDSRTHSKEFAEIAAKVLAGNEIHALLFKQLRPTPLVSFACREKKASAAIMITASHNPPEYNGYKVYWKDGGQVLPPHDRDIIQEVVKITTPDQVKSVASPDAPFIHFLGDEMDALYIEKCLPLQRYPKVNLEEGKTLSIVYTSLHGTGSEIIPCLLAKSGFSQVTLVPGQCIPDGTFPTVSVPNPEDPKALKLGIETLTKCDGDLLIATDPDADRVGVAVKHQGRVELINGNQLACILLEHVCRAGLEENAAFIKTIATTELFQAICDHYKRPCFNTLTGFKYIGQMMTSWEKGPYRFVFGGEESYGYLLGTLVRDKDACIIANLIAEAALHAKKQGKTLIDLLYTLYKRHGIYYEVLQSIQFPETKEGREKMGCQVDQLKNSPPKTLGNLRVVFIEDYAKSTKINTKTNEVTALDLPKSDALVLWLEDHTKILIRPSGTEPKVKVYLGLKQAKFTSIEEGLKACQKKADHILAELL